MCISQPWGFFLCLKFLPFHITLSIAYEGICSKGCAKLSWQKGNFDTVQISVSCAIRQQEPQDSSNKCSWEPTGFNFFLISISNVPAFIAIISGAESGSCAIGEPHSEQKIRWTALPELPMPAQLLVGPLISTLALGTTATRAYSIVSLQSWQWSPVVSVWDDISIGELLTICRATLPLAVIAMIVAREEGLVNINSVGHSFAQAVAVENHLEFDVDLVVRESWSKTAQKLFRKRVARLL